MMKPGRAVLVVSTCALLGCTRSLDMEGVKKAAGDLVKGTGATPKAVTCPPERVMKAGDTFDCTVDIEQGSVKVTFTQKDDQGNVDYKMTPTVLKIADLEKAIADNVKQALDADATVDCGPKFRPSTPGSTFECTARAGEQSVKYKVTVKDAAGNVGFEADVPPAAAADEEKS